MINRNASCYVSIIYDEKWLLRVFFSICLRVQRPLYIKILRFKRVLFLQIYNCTAFMFKQFCVRTQLHISAIYIQRVQIPTHDAHLATPSPFPRVKHRGLHTSKIFLFFLFFKSHDTINSQYSNRFMEFFHIIILWSLIF